ncbi:MAG: site-specific integrase [Gemmatimonadaceae bacterium]|nr:site-specific integrase [Gemmatimonadaceae bacterium]
MPTMRPLKDRQILATYGSHGARVTVISLVRRGVRRTVVFWREGRRREQTFDARTRREEESQARAFAETKAAVLQLRRTNVALPTPPEPITLVELRQRYLLAKGLNWARATRRNNDARWRKFADFVGGRTRAADVSLDTIDEWRAFLRDLKHEPSEIARMLTCVKAVYRWGIERDHVVSKIPMYSPEKLPGDKPKRIKEFTPIEVQKILAALKPRGKKVGRSGLVWSWRHWSLCWMTAASAKRTRSQMLPLEWTSVHFYRGGALIDWPAEHDKLRKEHRQPMPRRAAAMLRLIRWMAASEGLSSPYVWPARVDKETRRTVKHVGYQALISALHKACRRTGVPYRRGRGMHAFRRSSANTVIEAGGSIKDAGLWLNDDDIKTLSGSYLRERDGEQQRIADRMPSPDGRVKRKLAAQSGAGSEKSAGSGSETPSAPDGQTTDTTVGAVVSRS